MILETLQRLLLVRRFSAAARAYVSWPQFSVTSFTMLNNLRDQGLKPCTVIDVGANVGQFAVAAAKIFSDCCVISFEPDPANAERLTHNSRTLPIRVVNCALGDREGQAELHVNSHSHSNSLLSLGERHRTAFPDAKEVGTVSVRLSTLDRELESVLLQSPVLLKLDVQGFELNVLQGATKSLKIVDHVIVETSFRPMYEGEAVFDEIAAFLAQHDFQFLRPVGWLPDPKTGEILQMDALFQRRS